MGVGWGGAALRELGVGVGARGELWGGWKREDFLFVFCVFFFFSFLLFLSFFSFFLSFFFLSFFFSFLFFFLGV